jgi:adenylate cyclase
VQRKLTVIVSADVVSYAALMERDEAGTLERLKANRKVIFDRCVAAHGGRVVKLMGDGALVEFASVVSALDCAREIQQATESDSETPHGERIRYRIGITLGEVIVEDDDIYGDGVNMAARLQQLAAPGQVVVSGPIRDQALGKTRVEFDDLGEYIVRNMQRPLHVFALRSEEPKTHAAPQEKRQRSICVLPFANMSGDPEQEYFSDGITEDVITDLSKVSALWVAARNTSFTFKGRHVDVPQIVRQLNVTHILEGSVRKAGGRVRITAQLVDGASGGHIWAERYDRDLNDIFALQDEISQAIVAALKLKLLPEEKRSIEHRGTSNADAYNLYLMARQYGVTTRSDARSGEAIIRLCRRATEIDPDYARPWALMAYAQAGLRVYYGPDREDGLAAAERAISLDPNLAEAHAARGRVLTQRRRLDDARDEIETELRLDPDAYETNFAAGTWNFAMRRFDDAIRYFDKAATDMEWDYLAASAACSCYKAKGDMEAARRAARRAVDRTERIVAREPDNGSALGVGVLALSVLGEVERAKEWAERARLLDPDNLHMQYDLVCTYVEWGEFDTALDLLERMLEKLPVEFVSWVKVDADVDRVRDHPRFKAILAQAEARLAQASSQAS